MDEEKKHAGGRPRKYQTPEELELAVNTYFLETEEVEQTVCGLSLHLGFAQRKSLLDYEGYEGEFCNIIKKAIQRLENIREKALVSGKGNPAGVIFWLKNHGWRDVQETKHEFTGTFADFVKGLVNARNSGTNN